MLWHETGWPSFLRLNNILLCVYVTLCIHQWTFGLFPLLSSCEKCCSGHRQVSLGDPAFRFWVGGCIPRSGTAAAYVILFLIF